jgi:hypothetical protein
MCGIQLSQMTAHHRAANRLVECFHRTLKAAIMCHAKQWTEVLPLVLLRIRASFKEDLQASVAELMYSEPLRIPGELLTPGGSSASHHRATPTHGPPHTSSGSSPRLPCYIRAQGPEKCTHVFLLQDAMRRALEPPYSGPYHVLSRRDKMLQLLVCRRPVTVSTDRVKPAYILMRPTAEQPEPTSHSNPCNSTAYPATTASYKNYALWSPHIFPLSLQHLSNHLHGGMM